MAFVSNDCWHFSCASAVVGSPLCGALDRFIEQAFRPNAGLPWGGGAIFGTQFWVTPGGGFRLSDGLPRGEAFTGQLKIVAGADPGHGF